VKVEIEVNSKDLNVIAEAAKDCCQPLRKYLGELVEVRAAELRGFPARIEEVANV